VVERELHSMLAFHPIKAQQYILPQRGPKRACCDIRLLL
jgi:hypothetical protein